MLGPMLLLCLFACSDKDAGTDDDDDAIGLDTGWDGGSGDGGSSDGGSGDGGGTANDADNDGYDSIESGGDDCDDGNPDIHPFADEFCNGVDDDCDGNVDEDSAVDATKWYPDVDDDGYGDDDESDFSCDEPDDESAWITTGGDCDDEDADINPDAEETCDGVDEDCDEEVDEDATDAVDWYRDVDEDGFGGKTVEHACSPPDDGAAWSLDGGDCADDDELIHPDATEVCDDVDNDCDDLVDDADPSVDESTWTIYYADADEDGFGDADAPRLSCSRPDGHVLDDGDCNDGDADINPGEVEICDDADTDEDCSGAADDDDPDVEAGGMTTWNVDRDEDGYGTESELPVFACDDPSGDVNYVEDDTNDCNDDDPEINPEATEVCDDANVDEDCSGDADDDDAAVDPSTTSSWWRDDDEDGYGDGSFEWIQCDDPSTSATDYVTNGDDCDDDRADVSPAGTEVCDDDDTDEDCDGRADDDDTDTLASTKTTWYLDDDGDGFGDADTSLRQCEDPSDSSDDWLTDGSDCDDSRASVNPDAEEVCDDLDNDCDPRTTTDGWVSFVGSDGSSTDLTSAFGAGGVGSPVAYSLDDDGSLALCGGTFYVNLEVTADVDIVGYDDSILSGGGSGHVVYVEGSGATLSLTDLTIQDGVAERASPYGADYPGGGGVMCDGATVDMNGVLIQDNDAAYGGGVFLWDCDSVLTDVTIQGHDIDRWGAALWMYNGSLLMDSCLVQDNYGYRSGGLNIYGSADLVDTWVIDNSSGFYSGGLSVQRGTITCSVTSGGGGGFLRNDAGSAAIDIFPSGSGASFVSEGCDFGTGLDDNDPYDLELGYTEGYDYGNDATFTCTSTSSSDSCR